jgi:hypothetical protein
MNSLTGELKVAVISVPFGTARPRPRRVSFRTFESSRSSSKSGRPPSVVVGWRNVVIFCGLGMVGVALAWVVEEERKERPGRLARRMRERRGFMASRGGRESRLDVNLRRQRVGADLLRST